MSEGDGATLAEVHDVDGGEGHTVGVPRVTAERVGKPRDAAVALVIHARGGRFAGCGEHRDVVAPGDEFWS